MKLKKIPLSIPQRFFCAIGMAVILGSLSGLYLPKPYDRIAMLLGMMLVVQFFATSAFFVDPNRKKDQ